MPLYDVEYVTPLTDQTQEQLAKAGEEKKWLQAHWSEFQALANDGDEDMKGLMEELRTRADFADISITKNKESSWMA
ncbi:MAG: hypothetical protein Q9157_003123 [Trypethelium eluteriae]